ncbi:hypothetical protein EID30_02495 [Enterococcus faecium]|nr:hypothetical protein [Enterococcus faecium]
MAKIIKYEKLCFELVPCDSELSGSSCFLKLPTSVTTSLRMMDRNTFRISFFRCTLFDFL